MTAVQTLRIGTRVVGEGHPPLIIAEMSGNHNQSLATALEIVDAAAESGADAIKLQTYTPDTLTLDSHAPAFFLPSEGNPWAGQRLWDLYKEAYTPWEWHEPICERARSHGLGFISTAFDDSSVDFLERLDVDAIKIASFELVHIPLIERAAATGIPLIISTGMGSDAEIADAVAAVESGMGHKPILLKCTSAYPAHSYDANLLAITSLRSKYSPLVGVSDHSFSDVVVSVAVALGACVIEKHFTLDRGVGGPDSSFSLEPHEFKRMVQVAHESFGSLGSSILEAREVERSSLWERPSIWVTREVKRGERFTRDSVRVVRPSGGLAPKYLNEILESEANSDIPAASPLQRAQIAGEEPVVA